MNISQLLIMVVSRALIDFGIKKNLEFPVRELRHKDKMCIMCVLTVNPNQNWELNCVYGVFNNVISML